MIRHTYTETGIVSQFPSSLDTDTELVPEKDLAHWTRIPQFDVLGKVEVRHHQGKKGSLRVYLEYYLKFPKFQTKPIPVSPKHPGIFTYPRI